jgi:guanylate kinase
MQPIHWSGPGRRGILIIISSPSGAGKTTLSRRLVAEFEVLSFSVSFTTRTPRKTEVDGVDYRFVADAEFDRMIAAGELAEWAEVHGNRYGTARASVERALAEGRDTVFDIDWQGAKSLAGQWPDDVLKIFILPPSLESLADRLRRRATDAAQVIDRRLRRAVEEMAHYDEYEHIIVNDDLEEAYQTLRAVYLVRRFGEVERDDVPLPLASMAERVRRNREGGGRDLARTLSAARDLPR